MLSSNPDNQTSLQKALAETADLITGSVEDLLPTAEGEESRLFDSMRYGCLAGGKRLRPLLVLQTSSLFGQPTEFAGDFQRGEQRLFQIGARFEF